MGTRVTFALCVSFLVGGCSATPDSTPAECRASWHITATSTDPVCTTDIVNALIHDPTSHCSETGGRSNAFNLPANDPTLTPETALRCQIDCSSAQGSWTVYLDASSGWADVSGTYHLSPPPNGDNCHFFYVGPVTR